MRLVHTILWGMVWTYPLLVETMKVMQGGNVFSWTDVRHAWMGIVPFFLLFLLHRLPMYRLLLCHRVRAYCISALFLLALFAACRYFGMEAPPRHLPSQEHPMPSGNRQPPEYKPFVPDKDAQPAGPKKKPEPDKHRPPQPEKSRFVFFGVPGLLTIDLTIAMLMFGFDIAIVLLSRSQKEEERKRRLEALHKEHELEHLKAQINPHFFMNMLNNIHGMVEMDARLAQDMIMELSADALRSLRRREALYDPPTREGFYRKLCAADAQTVFGHESAYRSASTARNGRSHLHPASAFCQHHRKCFQAWHQLPPSFIRGDTLEP